MDAEDLPVHDLRTVITLGTARGGALLTAGEHHVARGLGQLSGGSGRLYARLSTRRPRCFRLEDLQLAGVADPVAAAAPLVEAGWLCRAVPWSWRAEALTIPVLAKACHSLGLRRGGRKAELVDRLRDHRGWCDGTWVRITHGTLVRRLERWAFMRCFPDRSTLVVDRLGLVRWPEYALTTGPGMHRDRRAMRRWESLLTDELSVEAALQGLERGWHRAPGRLDLGARLRRGVAEHAHALERDGQPGPAAEIYSALVASGAPPAAVAFRRARALEADGRGEEALKVLRQARPSAGPSEAVALSRAGRRMARQLRQGWAPDPPLANPPRRRLRVMRAPEATDPRAGWTVDGTPVSIEAAVCAQLAGVGRRAIHVEGSVWSTLFALLLADCYFLPVSGALPVPYLSGPLDLGIGAFRARRADAVDSVLAAVDNGDAARRVGAADARWRGTRLARAHWRAADRETLMEIADGVGTGALRAILERMLRVGRRASRGLPDLVILPGREVRLPEAHPSRLGPGLLLAEVKGPTDSLRDEQRVWLDVLQRAGAPAELWEVVPPP